MKEKKKRIEGKGEVQIGEEKKRRIKGKQIGSPKLPRVEERTKSGGKQKKKIWSDKT